VSNYNLQELFETGSTVGYCERKGKHVFTLLTGHLVGTVPSSRIILAVEGVEAI